MPDDLVLSATDLGRGWSVSGTAEDLLLWIYQRRALPETAADVVTAVRSLSSTDRATPRAR